MSAGPQQLRSSEPRSQATGGEAPLAPQPPQRHGLSPIRHGPIVLFLLAALVYLTFRSNHHYFDSVHYARMAESGDNLFWQKHILQHGLIRWLWLGQGEVAGGTSALRVAQWVNALAGAGAVTLVHLSLRRFCGASLAAACAVLFGLTGVVARHAIEGEVHILPLFLLTLALWLLVRLEPSPTAAVWIGLATAGAILTHQAYAVFVPAVLAASMAKGASRRALVLTLLAAAIPCAAIFGIVFSLTGESWAQWPHWMLHGAGLADWNMAILRQAGEALVNALAPSGNHYPVLRFDSLVPGAMLALLIIQGVRKRRPKTTPLLLFCGVVAGIGIPAITWHYPTFQYFCPIVLAVVIAAALGLATLPRRRAILVAWGMVAFYAAFAFPLVLMPIHDGTTNDALNRAKFVAEQTSRRDVILSTGTGAATSDLHYFPYFSKTRAVTLWEAHSRFGGAQLWSGFQALIGEASTGGGRLLLFADMVTPSKTFLGFLDTPLPLDGNGVRAALAKDYEFIEIATYRGAGYQEALLELRPRRLSQSATGLPCGLGCPFAYQCLGGRCQCGPQPHFQLREGRCLPSCGVLLNRQVAPPEVSGCCDHPCGPEADFASATWDTWDCRYCCGGAEGRPLCRDAPQ